MFRATTLILPAAAVALWFAAVDATNNPAAADLSRKEIDRTAGTSRHTEREAAESFGFQSVSGFTQGFDTGSGGGSKNIKGRRQHEEKNPSYKSWKKQTDNKCGNCSPQ